MRSLKYLCVIMAAFVLLVCGCGSESGNGLVTVDTVPPLPPVNMSVDREDDLVTVTWDENAETDLAGYKLYKSSSRTGPYETVTSGLLYCPWYYDQIISKVTTYYKATALDATGNESAFSQTVVLRFGSGDKKEHIVYPDKFAE